MNNKHIGEDNLIGAYCHFPVIGGLFVPLIVYFWKGKDNKELGFQAKQALVYQIIATVIAIAGFFITSMLYLAMFVSDLGILSMLVWPVYGGIILVIAVLPLLAAWKTFNKVSYDYPVIGGMLR
ncbi:MAG: DUF4870 domain-containing protein [Candidatus Altiarchaeota archaeon]|nr:DUF4870 domain-containing protein [Candidatus Altiarchaeota archaeon]